MLLASARCCAAAMVRARGASLSAAHLAPWMTRTYASLPPHTVINMPALSPTMTQGNIGAWKKAVGDDVQPGDVLVEIETDKAHMEFECQDEGTLAKILLDAGAKDVPVGTPIAVMCDEPGDVSAFKDYTGPKSPKPSTAAAPSSAPAASAGTSAPALAPASAAASAAPQGDRVFASPLAKNLATQHGLQLNTIQGSGPNSRIVKADIERTLAQPQPATAQPATTSAPQASPAATATDTPFVDVPLSNMRKVIAARLSESKQTVPHYYLTAEISMDRALKLREVLNAKLAEQGNGKLSVNDLVVKASALALLEVPAVNAAWWPATGSVRQFQRADVAVAVATDAGLITPIVRGAETLGLAKIGSAVRSLAAKAKANKLQPAEYQGGSFTISNLGMYGSVTHFAAIVNPPQSAILAVGGLADKVVRDRDSGEFRESKVMSVTLSCDHRVVDGAVGAQWLAAFKKYMEEPLNMML